MLPELIEQVSTRPVFSALPALRLRPKRCNAANASPSFGRALFTLLPLPPPCLAATASAAAAAAAAGDLDELARSCARAFGARVHGVI